MVANFHRAPEPTLPLPDVLLERVRPHLAPRQLAAAEGEAQALVARWPPEASEPVKGAVPGQVLPAGGQDCES